MGYRIERLAKKGHEIYEEIRKLPGVYTKKDRIGFASKDPNVMRGYFEELIDELPEPSKTFAHNINLTTSRISAVKPLLIEMSEYDAGRTDEVRIAFNPSRTTTVEATSEVIGVVIASPNHVRFHASIDHIGHLDSTPDELKARIMLGDEDPTPLFFELLEAMSEENITQLTYGLLDILQRAALENTDAVISA